MQELTGLPTELLALISSFLPHDDVLSFALTCRSLRESALDELHARQRTFHQFKTINDFDPLSVLTNLRQILADPFKAQCVRYIRFSDLRVSWRDWRPSGSSTEPLLETEAADDANSTIWKKVYSHDELEEFRRLLRLHVFPGFTGNTLSNAHISMLRHGHDDTLKVLLIAICPRLQSLTFHELDATSNRVRSHPHPLAYSFLAQHQAVHRIFNREARLGPGNSPALDTWSPGFRSLRSISLCAPPNSGHRSTMPFRLRPANVSGLFWLPRIETLEFHHLQQRHDGDGWIDVEIGCSSVRTLKFEDCEIEQATLLRLVTSSRRLERLDIARSGALPENMGRWVRRWYGPTLTHVAVGE